MSFVLLLLLFISACTPQTVAPGSVPEFSLSLRCSAKGGRLTYFELAPDGALGYGGGRFAQQRVTEPALTLSSEQRRAVWTIIQKHDLLHAEGSGLFAGGAANTNYELTLQAAGRSNSLHAIDDALPGVKELHDALFKMQADARYGRALPGLPGTRSQTTQP
jgi:hypothetical protein